MKRRLGIWIVISALALLNVYKAAHTFLPLPLAVDKSNRAASHRMAYAAPMFSAPAELTGDGLSWRDRALKIDALYDSRFANYDAGMKPTCWVCFEPMGLLVCFDVALDPQVGIKSEVLNRCELNLKLTGSSGKQYGVTVRNPDTPNASSYVYDQDGPLQRDANPKVQIVGRAKHGGFSVEARLPLAAVDAGKEASLEAEISLTDGRRLACKQLWRPASPEDADDVPILVPSRTPSNPIEATATCRPVSLYRQVNYRDKVLAEIDRGGSLGSLIKDGLNSQGVWKDIVARSGYRVEVVPAHVIQGEMVTVRNGSGAVLALSKVEGTGPIILDVPQDVSGGKNPVLSVWLGSQQTALVTPAWQRADLPNLSAQPVNVAFDSYLLRSPNLPTPLLLDPIEAKWSLKPYSLTAEYFDHRFAPVSTAKAEGRYGARAELSVMGAPAGTYFGTVARTGIHDPIDSNSDSLSYPRVPSAEAAAIAWLGARERAGQQMTSEYDAFDRNQAWMLKLKSTLGIKFPKIGVLPQDYAANPKKRWPLVVYLHGGGAQELSGLEGRVSAETITRVARGEIGPFGNGKGKHPTPFILVDPLLSIQDLRWTPAIFNEVVQEAESELRIDPGKVFLSGHSAGAEGAFRIGMAEPGRISGITLLGMEEYDTPDLGRLKGLPILMYAGEKDRASSSVMKDLASKINLAGGHAEFRVVKGAEHYIPPNVYPQEDIWKWMLSQKPIQSN